MTLFGDNHTFRSKKSSRPSSGGLLQERAAPLHLSSGCLRRLSTEGLSRTCPSGPPAARRLCTDKKRTKTRESTIIKYALFFGWLCVFASGGLCAKSQVAARAEVLRVLEKKGKARGEGLQYTMCRRNKYTACVFRYVSGS